MLPPFVLMAALPARRANPLLLRKNRHRAFAGIPDPSGEGALGHELVELAAVVWAGSGRDDVQRGRGGAGIRQDGGCQRPRGGQIVPQSFGVRAWLATDVIQPDGLRQMDVIERKLKATIEGQHGGTAHLAYIDAVSETRQGRPVEGGIMFVFDLVGHPEAARAYGWTSQVGEEDERQFHVVLQAPPITSAQDAVRSMTESQDGRSGGPRALSPALLCRVGPPTRTKPAQAA
jgi:hypothetical protein